MSTKLFVGNLSFNTTENEIHEAFAAHGTVVEANLMMDRMSGRSRGFAFVTMSTPEEAQKAIEAMNGASLGDRALTVNIARPKEERPRGGGGDGVLGPLSDQTFIGHNPRLGRGASGRRRDPRRLAHQRSCRTVRDGGRLAPGLGYDPRNVSPGVPVIG